MSYNQMKTVLAVLLFLFISYSQAQNWSQITDFSGTGRDDGTSFRINSKVYCGTGLDIGFNVTNDFYAFDLAAESWSTIASLPISLQYSTSFSHNGSGYVFGGINNLNEYQADLWKYDPAFDSWSLVSQLPSEGRSGLSNFIIGDTVYFVGGKNSSSSALSEVWAFDLINNDWYGCAELPNDGMWRGVSFSSLNEGIVGLGKDSLNALNNDFYRYNPDSDLWSLVPELTTTPRIYGACSQINGKVFLYGGVDSLGNYLNSFERIDFDALVIEPLSVFPSIARKGCMAFTSDNDFYISTGVSLLSRLKETWVARDILTLEGSKTQEFDAFNIYQSKGEIIVDGDWDDTFHLSLYSLAGSLISSASLAQAPLNVRELETGIYYYLINSDSYQQRGKLLITND